MRKSVVARVIVQPHPKRMLDAKDLQIIRKKADSILVSVLSSFTTESFKAILKWVRDLELAKQNTLQPFEETRQKLQKPSCFNFSSGFDVSLFDFSPA